MKITLDISQIFIEDEWIDAFVAQTVLINIQYSANCGEIITIVPELADINVSGQYTLNVDEGIYYIKLNNITDSNNILSKELCIVNISEATQCLVVDAIANKCNVDLIKSYSALQLINQCTECKCKNACAIYEDFLNILNNECNC